jgi:hypothetical protein
MSYDVAVARGNPKHLAGRVEKLNPLDEAAVWEVLRAPPADVELHDGDGDEVVWAGESVAAQMLLVRSDEGTLRAVEAGLTGGSGAGGADEYAAVLLRLVDLADRVGGHLYEPPFHRRDRLSRGDVERMAAEMRAAPVAPPAERLQPLLVEFYDLSDDAAEAHLERHAARAAEGLAAFRRQVAALGGPAEDELDDTPESVERLGRWVFGPLRDRYPPVVDGAVQRLYAGDVPQPTIDEWRRDRPGEPDELPPWCAQGADHARSPLPPSALWLADGLGYYLAACLSRELGEGRWEVYRGASRRLRDVDENSPVLAIGGGRRNVHRLAYVVVLKALAFRDDEPEMLPRVYQLAVEQLAAERGA